MTTTQHTFHSNVSVSVSVRQAVAALTRRELLRSLASPAVTIQSILFPAVLLMTLLAVFGSAVAEFTGGEVYVQRITPALIISGAAFGSLGTAVGLFEDRTSGFFDRLRLTPFQRGGAAGYPAGSTSLRAMMLARSISEHVRVLLVAIALTLVGSAFGFRFEGGLGRALAFFALATLFGASFCWIGFALAAGSSSMEAVTPPLSGLFLILLFLSHGMVPLEAFPGAVQPIVEVAPSSVMMLTLQRLSGGGDLSGPALGATAWAVFFTVVFGTIAMRRMRAMSAS